MVAVVAWSRGGVVAWSRGRVVAWSRGRVVAWSRGSRGRRGQATKERPFLTSSFMPLDTSAR